ncbi:MAG: hypothetical protein CM15mP21_4970 [Hyphomicrobiales bacterium]|nr:MAG: hypothetical protein CM15mP21_4970 [Hyphomicrobiales bacterium]
MSARPKCQAWCQSPIDLSVLIDGKEEEAKNFRKMRKNSSAIGDTYQCTSNFFVY